MVDIGRREPAGFLAGLNEQPFEEPLSARSTSDRLLRVLADLSEPSAVVVLTGDSGNGKVRLAEEAAKKLQQHIGELTEVIVLPRPPRLPSGLGRIFSLVLPEITEMLSQETEGRICLQTTGCEGEAEAHHDAERHDDAESAAERLVHAELVLELFEQRAEGRALVIVAPEIDRYDPAAARILEVLVRSGRARVIATATRLTGTAARIARDSRTRVCVLGPFTRAEAGEHLTRFLRVEHIEAQTLRRWHALSGGNAHALTMIALACDRRGVLKRSRGMAWVDPGHDAVPGEFADFLRETCTPEEIRALEFLVIAEPIAETALLRELDAGCVDALYERGFIMSETYEAGATAMVVAHPLLSVALLELMSPMRRMQLNEHIFRVLRDDPSMSDPLMSLNRLMRLVFFGLESGARMPIEWMLVASDSLRRRGTYKLWLPVALAIARHADATPSQACWATIEAYRIARLVGDKNSRRLALLEATRLLDGGHELSVEQTIELRFVLLEDQFLAAGSSGAPMLVLRELLETASGASPSALARVRGRQVLALALNGRLREALQHAPEETSEAAFEVERAWVSTRLATGLIWLQQGRVREAIAVFTRARRLVMLGDEPRADLADIAGFATFLGHWVCGSGSAAAHALAELERGVDAGSHDTLHYAGLIDGATALLALQEGRWLEAVQELERLLDRMTVHDAYGIEPLLRAALGLALAVLGEAEAAERELVMAEAASNGLAEAFRGIRLVLVLRAKLWLRASEVGQDARALADWARGEELALVELAALHVLACAEGPLSTELTARVDEIGGVVDRPIGHALAAHIRVIATGAEAAEAPEARVLAEIGVWLPMPAAPELTPREREIALLASLGYTSRLIAERFHISVRTVETHLAHVFTKLGMENREALRRWFATARARG